MLLLFDLDIFVCEECGWEFRSRSGISDHRRRHNNKAPYKCCGKSFYSMESVTIFWSLVVLATLRVSSSDEIALQYEIDWRPEWLGPRADISIELNATTNDNNRDPENRIREELADKLIDEIKTGIRNGMQHDLVNEFHLDTQSHRLERKRRSPPRLLRALYFLPFRGFLDFYHTLNDILFHTPGFVAGILNILIISLGGFGGGGSRVSVGLDVSQSRTGSSSMSTELTSFIRSDEFRNMKNNVQIFVAENDITEISNILQSYSIEKVAMDLSKWIEFNVDNTTAVQSVLGSLDAFRSMQPKGMLPSKATSTNHRTEGRVQSDKNTRKLLKMLWERRGLSYGGPTNNNSAKDATDVDGMAKVTHSNTRNVFTDFSTGANSNNADNKIDNNSVLTGNNGQEVWEMSDTTVNELNIEDTIESVLQSQNSDFMISNVRQNIPRLLKLLSENGFTIFDLRDTVDVNDLSDGGSIESILKDLKANKKFVTAMTKILDVSTEDFAGMGEIELLLKLRDVLTS